MIDLTKTYKLRDSRSLELITQPSVRTNNHGTGYVLEAKVRVKWNGEILTEYWTAHGGYLSDNYEHAKDLVEVQE